MPSDERDFDELPEALRLALLDLARRRLRVEGHEMSVAQIAEAAAIPYASAQRRLAVALLKLRPRADELDLNPHP